MKFILLLLLLCFVPISVCQAQMITTSSGDTIHFLRLRDIHNLLDTVINDTFFIERTLDSQNYYRVYIEKDRNSKYYKRMFDNSYWNRPRKDYYWDQVRKASKSFSKQFKKNQPLGLPKDWLPLYPFRGSYYIWTPVDWAASEVVRLNDHSISHPGMEDQFYSPFIKGHWVNKKTYHAEYCSKEALADNNSNPNPDSCDVIFHVLDKSKGLLLIEYPNIEKEYRYRLYVSLDHAKEYEMIVTESDTVEPIPLPTDPIDGEVLLKEYND